MLPCFACHIRIYTRDFARRAFQLVHMSRPSDLPPRTCELCTDRDARELFQAEPMDELCHDAELFPFLVYLRGCRTLEIPAEWYPLIPKKL